MTNANLRVFFFLGHAESYKNFQNSKICAVKVKATEKGLLRKITKSSRAKIQTFTYPLGQYPICKIQVDTKTTFQSFRVHFCAFFRQPFSN